MSRRPQQRRGDEADLYHHLHASLEHAVRVRVRGPAATVEDACAFAWEQLLRSQPERSDRLFHWLVTVAVREGWRLARIERRHAAVGTELAACAPEEREFAARLRALEALDALAAVRPAERRLLYLHAAGYSYREIMAIERRSYRWVDRHLVHARRQLRRTEGGEN